MLFNSLNPTVVFQEVPDEISLCFSITGCQLGCKGCHSTELWKAQNGTPLTNKTFQYWLNKYQPLISCVLFMGGEWNNSALLEKLIIAKKAGLKTCLYSGLDFVAPNLLPHLNFLKTGRWQIEHGGLNNQLTNQRFINVATGELLNYKFTKNNNKENNNVAA